MAIKLADIVNCHIDSIGFLEGPVWNGDWATDSAIIMMTIEQNTPYNLNHEDVYLIVKCDTFFGEPEIIYYNGERMMSPKVEDWPIIQDILVFIEDQKGKPVPELFYKLVAHLKDYASPIISIDDSGNTQLESITYSINFKYDEFNSTTSFD